MKLKIKVKVLTKGCMPKIIEKGEWIDLKLAETIHLMPSQAGTLKKKQEQGLKVKSLALDLLFALCVVRELSYW